jgi:hypothetical protein
MTSSPDPQKRGGSFSGNVTGYSSSNCGSETQVVTWNLDGGYSCLEQDPTTEMFSVQIVPDAGIEGDYNVTWYADGGCGTVQTFGTYNSVQGCLQINGGYNSVDIGLLDS